jgi:hypothetical protein
VIAVAMVSAVGVTVGAVLAVVVKIRPEWRKIRADAATVAHEVQHNSGGSMKDSISRIEAMVSEQGRDIRYLRGDLRAHEQDGAQQLEDLRVRIRSLESPPAERDSP